MKLPVGKPPSVVDIAQCDVNDKDALKEYREERQKWLSWYELQADEPHSIQQQIFSMMFLDMCYRVLSSARVPKKDATVSASAGILAHFLDQGYVATQIL